MRGGRRQRYLALSQGGRERSRSPRRPPPDSRPGLRAAAVQAQANLEGRDVSGERFYKYVGRLHLSNKLSAKDTQTLSSTATAAGAASVAGLASAGAHGACPGNTHRDLLRRYLKDTKMPSPYYAEVSIHDPEQDKDHVKVMLPFLLPHEMIHAIMKNSPASATSLSELPEGSPLDNNAIRISNETGVSRNRIIPIGFHGDGVPHKKNKSVQVCSWMFWLGVCMNVFLLQPSMKISVAVAGAVADAPSTLS